MNRCRPRYRFITGFNTGNGNLIWNRLRRLLRTRQNRLIRVEHDLVSPGRRRKMKG